MNANARPSSLLVVEDDVLDFLLHGSSTAPAEASSLSSSSASLAPAAAPAVSTSAPATYGRSRPSSIWALPPSNPVAPSPRTEAAVLTMELADVDDQISALRRTKSIVDADFESMEDDYDDDTDTTATEEDSTRRSGASDGDEAVAFDAMMKLKSEIAKLRRLASDSSATAASRAKATRAANAKQASLTLSMAALKPLEGRTMKMSSPNMASASLFRLHGPLTRFLLFCAFVATLTLTLLTLGYITSRALAEAPPGPPPGPPGVPPGPQHHAAGGAPFAATPGATAPLASKSPPPPPRATMLHKQRTSEAEAWRRESVGELSKHAPKRHANGKAVALRGGGWA